jgi:hypothetical protein
VSLVWTVELTRWWTTSLRTGEKRAMSEISIEYKGVVYSSPSSAGNAALGRNINGWDFWHVERDGRTVKLAVVRAEYLAGRRGDAR